MQPFKRGASFSLAVRLSPTVNGQPVTDLTGWAGRSRMVTVDGTLVQDLTFGWIDIATRTAALTASAAQTLAWPKGELALDIALSPPDAPAIRVISGTIKITVGDAITPAAA